MAENLLTPEFRVSFANVFRPQKNKEDPEAQPKYGLTHLFLHPSEMSPAYKKEYDEFLAKLKKQMSEVAFEKWGEKAKTMKLRTPFHDQGEKSYDGYIEGAMYFNSTSKQKPGLIDGRKNNEDIIEEKDFYSGCYARAKIRAFAYGGPGTKYAPGVGIGLQHVQKTRDGEPLGGRTRPQDEFEPVSDAAVSESKSAEDIFG